MQRVYLNQAYRTLLPGLDERAMTPLCRLYTSIDPAPPSSGLLAGTPSPEEVSEAGILALKNKLLDTRLSLFERYRAMFALRNVGTPAAVDALAAGFSDGSALFKYVISYSVYSCLP